MCSWSWYWWTLWWIYCNCLLIDVYSIWERERQGILDERKAKHDAAKQQVLATAQEELKKFYADEASRLDKVQKTNRADEKSFKQDMSTVMAHGTRWEKVNKLVNLQPKPNEKPGTSRVDRFRKILLTLKQSKDNKENL